MTNGYSELWKRRLAAGGLDHRLVVFQDWCLHRMSLEPTTAVTKGGQVDLLPGEFVMSQRQAASALCMGAQSIRTCVNNSKKEGFLTTKPTQNLTRPVTIISVTNWSSYGILKLSPNAEPNAEPNAKKTTKKRKPETNKMAIKFAKAMASYLTENMPTLAQIQPAKIDATIQAWARTFRLMNERDGPGRSWDEMRTAMEFVWKDVREVTDRTDFPGWGRTVQSADGFKKKYDKIRINMFASKG